MDMEQANELGRLRETIQKIDEEIVRLFTARMECAGQVAQYKQDHDLPVLNSEVEKRKMEELSLMVPEPFRESLKQLYAGIFAVSREYQERLIREGTGAYRRDGNEANGERK